MEIVNFENWLNEIYLKKNGGKISESSIKKYSNAINTISKDMLNNSTINKALNEMNRFELDISIEKILNCKEFIDKDTTGNRMYSSALKKYRCYRFFTELENEGIFLESLQDEKGITEKEVMIKNRIGQQTFKKQLLKKYNGRCIITGISITTVLVASHIKPWAVSNNQERLDPNNGLLLSATFDKLFDGGLITFSTDGKLFFSSLISDENLKILNLDNKKVYDIKLEDRMKEYLKYHNDVIFVK